MSIRHSILPTITSCVFSGVNPRAGGFFGLLDEFTGASAAYSLRKLSKDATNAVRVRRSTDGVEVKVAFDSDNTISNNSPITNVSGEPARSLTLGSTWVKITGSAGVETFSPLGSLNVQGTYSTPYRIYFSLGETVPSGTTLNFSAYVNSVTGSAWSVFPAESDNSIAISGSPLSVSGTGTLSGSFVLNADSDRIILENSTGSEDIAFNYGVSVSASVGDTAATTLGAFLSEASSPDLHVVTWYDQSGNSKDAPQPTQSDQPRIAIGGSILVDANGKPRITFDGTGDDLNLPDVISSINSATAFNVCEQNWTSGTEVGLALSRTTSASRRFYLPARTANGWFFSYGNDFDAIANQIANSSEADNDQHLFSAVAGSSTAKAYLDGVEKVSVASVDQYNSQSVGGIGSHNGGNNWTGDISEIIVYDSDQTASFADINSKIKTYYNIS